MRLSAILMVVTGAALHAAPVVAQQDSADAPPSQVSAIRFGVTLGQGIPQGTFADASDRLSGFVAWFGLPFTRTSPLGLRAEFSVLEVPAQVETRSVEGGGELELTLRGTVNFTGAGPRLAGWIGPVVAVGAVQIGYTRLITDITGTLGDETTTFSDAISFSEYALAGKATLDLVLPIFDRGGAALGATAGLDYMRSSAVPFPVQGTFDIEPPGTLVVENADVELNMFIWRVGVAFRF